MPKWEMVSVIINVCVWNDDDDDNAAAADNDEDDDKKQMPKNTIK